VFSSLSWGGLPLSHKTQEYKATRHINHCTLISLIYIWWIYVLLAFISLQLIPTHAKPFSEPTITTGTLTVESPITCFWKFVCSNPESELVLLTKWKYKRSIPRRVDPAVHISGFCSHWLCDAGSRHATRTALVSHVNAIISFFHGVGNTWSHRAVNIYPLWSGGIKRQSKIIN
jgi:hypothetical protein